MEVGQHAPEVEAAEASDEDVEAYIGKATVVREEEGHYYYVPSF